MCIFSGEVRVANTQIFARLSGHGTQYLVYQMQYEAKEPVAMILPLPVSLPARPDSLRFISLQHFPEFFMGFCDIFGIGAVAAGSAYRGDVSLLDVQEVGDFVASFVPTQSDFARLDPRFVLPETVWEHLPNYQNYGFAVFQLKELLGTTHPMAFEFSTRLPDQLFFPTVHVHDGEVNEIEHFDHVLFFQGQASQGELSPHNLLGIFSIEQTGDLLDLESPARMVELHGSVRNSDILIDLHLQEAGFPERNPR